MQNCCYTFIFVKYMMTYYMYVYVCICVVYIIPFLQCILWIVHCIWTYAYLLEVSLPLLHRQFVVLPFGLESRGGVVRYVEHRFTLQDDSRCSRSLTNVSLLTPFGGHSPAAVGPGGVSLRHAHHLVHLGLAGLTFPFSPKRMAG